MIQIRIILYQIYELQNIEKGGNQIQSPPQTNNWGIYPKAGIAPPIRKQVAKATMA